MQEEILWNDLTTIIFKDCIFLLWASEANTHILFNTTFSDQINVFQNNWNLWHVNWKIPYSLLIIFILSGLHWISWISRCQRGERCPGMEHKYIVQRWLVNISLHEPLFLTPIYYDIFTTHWNSVNCLCQGVAGKPGPRGQRGPTVGTLFYYSDFHCVISFSHLFLNLLYTR